MAKTSSAHDPKQKIVNAAFRALCQNGLPPLSYDVIAKEANLSRQVVRYHFKTPDDLMVALCDMMASVYREGMIAGVIQSKGPDRLNLFLDFYFDLLPDMPKPRDDQAYDALMSLAAGSDRVAEALRLQYGLLGQVLISEFMLEYPSLELQAAQELSYLFVCLMYGRWKMVASLGFSEDHKHITRRAMDRLIQSYVDNQRPMRPLDTIWKQKVE